MHMEDNPLKDLPYVGVHRVDFLDGFTVRLHFDNGTDRVLDLECYLWGPVFEPHRTDPAFFRSVTLDHGVLTWPNDTDIDSFTLYYNLRPAWMDERKDE